MALRLREQWKELTRGTPGTRFRDRHFRHQRRARKERWALRLVRFVAAALAAAVGVVLAFLPGPAVLFFLIAGALLASEWLWMARMLDWLEIRLRRLARFSARLWRSLPAAGRVVVVLVAASASAVSTWGLYHLVR